MPPTFWSTPPAPPVNNSDALAHDMAMRVSYGSRASDLDVRRASGGARQIARPPCSSLAEAIDAIKADIKAGEESEIPHCTVSEVTLGIGAVLELHRPNIGPYSEGGEHDLPEDFKNNWRTSEGNEEDAGKTCPTATVDEVTTVGEKHARTVVQRAASRGIVAAIELADGFKYSINNAWAAKDADGQRFSYICQDSMQNKDRHANGFTRTQKHLKGEGERGPRKPTYDCKGSVSIKCSMVRRSIDIFYRHYAIHSSVAERRNVPPPPRVVDSSFRKPKTVSGTLEDGGLLGRLQGEKTAFTTPPGLQPASHGVSNIGKPLKRKRSSDTPMKAGKPLSLVDLLRQSEGAEKGKVKEPDAASKKTSTHPPPMNYDLPSWQKPPPPPPPPPRAVQIPRATQSSTTSNPYPPPYQPPSRQQNQQQQQHVTPQHQPPPSYPDQGYYSQNSTDSQANSHSNQPMYSTLKAIPVDPTPTPTFYSGRTRSSCTNCRYGKKKCDETRPVCNNCAKVGKFDCAYDGAYGYPASAAQQAQMGGWHAVQSPVQMATPVNSQGYGHQQYQQYQGPSQPRPQQAQMQMQFRPPPAAPPMSQCQQSPSQGQQEREESPDPWFPKR